MENILYFISLKEIILISKNNSYKLLKYNIDKEKDLLDNLLDKYNIDINNKENILNEGNINLFISNISSNIKLDNNLIKANINNIFNYNLCDDDISIICEIFKYIYLSKCNLCPRSCNINRYKYLGYCKANEEIKIANYSLHLWEEPCISFKNGSGTIFFSYCNLNCIYCQNYEISKYHKGKNISIDSLVNIMLELQNKGADNINLVTPTHYIIHLILAINIARKKGLNLSIIYNTSGYENINMIKLLENNIDIYLPDLKYYDNDIAKKYSNCNNYFLVTTKAIKEMYNQVGKTLFDKNGKIKKGLIVRHLVLPGHTNESKKIIKYLYDTYKDNIYISIMNQYTPLREIKYNNLNRKLTDKEYNEVIDYAYDIGVRNAFVQDGETQSESFIPIFSDEI